jgi:1-phosphofructokinase
MITTISLNPAIDKTILLTDFKRGEVNRLTSVREDIAGKGINVAKILNKLNVPIQVCGFVGKQNRPYFEDLLRVENLPHQFLEADGPTRINTKLVELDQGITTDLNEPGFLITEEQVEQFKTILLKNASQSDYMVFNGSVPRGVPDGIYRDLISIVSSYSKTILDADGNLLLEGMKADPYMIKPNIHELEAAFHTKFNSDQEIITFCQSLLNN